MLQEIKDAHEIANDYFFKGMLNMPNFLFYEDCLMDDIGNICDKGQNITMDKKTVGSVWGYYLAETNTIGLTVNDNIYYTLLHEMIHQYQQEFNLIDKDHGGTFRKFARFIELTLNLERGVI